MPKAPDNLTPKKNASQERLRATPFSSTSQLDAETHALRLSIWKRVTTAQITNELLSKPENAFILEEWKAGLTATLSQSSSNERVYRIFSDGRGLKLELNNAFIKSLGEDQIRFVEGVVRAGIEGYGSLYLRGKGIPLENIGNDLSSGDPSKPE